MKKSFDQIYLNIFKNGRYELNKAKSEKDKSYLITIALIVLINGFIFFTTKETALLLITLSISTIVFLIVVNIKYSEYRRAYKELVIERMVKEYSENLRFSSISDLSSNDYRMSRFDNSYDRFSSEDEIYGKIHDNAELKMAQITTKEEKVNIDSDGRRTTETIETFKGLYGAIWLKMSSNCDIHIAADSFFKKYSANRVEIDSGEFEKYFDCITGDRITAMKIFTSDLIEKFVELRKETKAGFEVKIQNNIIYFRYKCGEMFEPPKIRDNMDKDLLKKYFKTFSVPIEIFEQTIENINNLYL